MAQKIWHLSQPKICRICKCGGLENIVNVYIYIYHIIISLYNLGYLGMMVRILTNQQVELSNRIMTEFIERQHGFQWLDNNNWMTWESAGIYIYIYKWEWPGMSWISTSQTSVWIRTPWNDCKTQHKCTIPLPLLMGLDHPHVKHPTPSPIHLARPTCIHEGCWNASWGIERRHRCIHSCHCWLRASASHHWAHGGAHFRQHRVGMVARGGWWWRGADGAALSLATSGPLEAAFTGGHLWQVGLFRDLHDLL